MEPKLGDEALCAMCGERIVYVGPYWSHVGAPQPRHPAVPKEEKEPESTVTIGHRLWADLLAKQHTDPGARFIFEAILESTLVDHITTLMHKSDEFATVIGQRITQFKKP